MNSTLETIVEIDKQLSRRPIALDPGGYLIIYLDRSANLIYAKHYTNLINDKGLAVDPDTGEVIAARGKKVERQPSQVFSGRTAKEICVEIFEKTQPCPVTMFDHAAYLGRELMRAEYALISGEEYIQD